MAMGIYTIEGPNGYYIGSAVNVAQRWRAHRGDLRRGKHHNPYLQCAWNKYGPDAFTFRLIVPVVNRDDLHTTEQHWLDWLFAAFPRDAIYNSATNVRSMLGHKLSPEHRHKLSLAFKGKPTSERHRAAVRAAAARPERRRQISQYLKGRVKSTEHRSNISAARAEGYAHDPQLLEAQRERVRALNETKKKTLTLISPTGDRVVIHGIKQFARDHGFNVKSFKDFACGRRKSYRGWRIAPVE